MKRKIFMNWNWVRRVWLLIGTGTAIAAIAEHNYLLLLPALYFVVGAIANVGCFAQSFAVNFKNNKEAETEN
jgi:hypothetical protein